MGYLEELYSQIYPWVEDAYSSQISTFKNKSGFFPKPDPITTFSSLVIYGISEIKTVSFDIVLRILNAFSTEPFSVSFKVILLSKLSAAS